jgi:hypothetical protein
MSTPGGFDMSKMSTVTKILLAAGVLYLINLFLDWQHVCFGGFCGGASGMEGIGILNLLLVIALLAWEGMGVAGVDIKAPRALVSAGLAGALVVFTLLKILIDSEEIYIFAWVGLILAAVIGYGGWMRWQEAQASGGGMSMGGGGGTGGMPPSPPPSDPGTPTV